jgi:hypothetical protein
LRSVQLIAGRTDLLAALRVLGTHRRRRFASIVPIWLHHDEINQELMLTEENATVQAAVHATGTWPAAGATVNLFLLRRAVTNSPVRVELYATESAILVLTAKGYVSLDLLSFGPNSERPAPTPPVDHHSDLPIFSYSQTLNPAPRTLERYELLRSRSDNPLALHGADEVFQLTHDACLGSRAAIRIARRQHRVTLVARVRAMPSAVPIARKRLTTVRKRLTIRDWTLLTTTADGTGFWSMPECHEQHGFDGFTWKIEARTADRYHRSACFAPTRGLFLKLGSLFARLAGIELPEDQP